MSEQDEPRSENAAKPPELRLESAEVRPPGDYMSPYPTVRRSNAPGAVYSVLMFFAGFIVGCVASVGLTVLQLELARAGSRALNEDGYLVTVTVLKTVFAGFCLWFPRGRAFGIGVILSTIAMRTFAHLVLCGFGNDLTGGMVIR